MLETPKPGDEVFGRSEWHCLLDNAAALDSFEARAAARGWIVERDLHVDDEPVGVAAETLLADVQLLAARNPRQGVAVITGGELSSPVSGDGRGGRNTAFVLRMAQLLAELGVRATVISAGTDGIDGNCPAAGAVADETTVQRGRELGMDPADYERRSDSFSYFDALGDALITGPTGNNVRDLRMIVIEG